MRTELLSLDISEDAMIGMDLDTNVTVHTYSGWMDGYILYITVT